LDSISINPDFCKVVDFLLRPVQREVADERENHDLFIDFVPLVVAFGEMEESDDGV
jgi:hypothetical protein